MTKYLDEYVPGSKQRNRQVQSDDEKLKFMNVLSCAALVVVPVGGKTMTGVHVSVKQGKEADENLKERELMLRDLRKAAGSGQLDAYIVCAWDFYKDGSLGKDLKKLARHVYLCDIPKAKLDANVDVMMKMVGERLQASVREKAEKILDANKQIKIKPGYDRKTHEPGKPYWETDKDSKPWMPVPFTRLL